MSKLRRSWIVLMLAVGLIAAAGVASADDTTPEDQPPAGDTLINFGYDAENHVFIVNTSTTDADYDCALPASELKVGYGAVEGAFEITPDPEAELNAECVFKGGVVGAPNGQINHGQFMKLFHQVAGKKANGCLNRIIAQSDLGKGDQQVRTSDVEEGFTPGDAGKVEFESFVAVCEHDKKDKGDDHPSKNKGHQDRADRSRGNSGNARGHNK